MRKRASRRNYAAMDDFGNNPWPRPRAYAKGGGCTSSNCGFKKLKAVYKQNVYLATRFIARLIALLMASASIPYFLIKSLGAPDSPKVSCIPTNSMGVG